jgi:hypothetical protein
VHHQRRRHLFVDSSMKPFTRFWFGLVILLGFSRVLRSYAQSNRLWQTADAAWTLICAAPLHPFNETSCPQNLPFSINYVCCNPRLVETRCLVCCVRCTYSPPLTLGVVYVSLIPTCLRICVCSIYLIALVASCSVLTIVLTSPTRKRETPLNEMD